MSGVQRLMLQPSVVLNPVSVCVPIELLLTYFNLPQSCDDPVCVPIELLLAFQPPQPSVMVQCESP